MSVERPRPRPTFTQRNSNFLQSYEVDERDLIIRTGRNRDNRYIGFSEMMLGKIVFDELKQDYHVPVVPSRLVVDKWIHTEEREHVLIVPKVKPYMGEFSEVDRHRFVHQAKAVCDNVTQYYQDIMRLNEGALAASDMGINQYMFGSINNRIPQLWMVDVDPMYIAAWPHVMTDPLADIGAMARYFEWLTGVSFETQQEHVRNFQGMGDRMKEIMENINAHDEADFAKMPTAYLRDKLIVR